MPLLIAVLLAFIVGLSPAQAQTSGWEFPAAASYLASSSDNGKILSTENVPGASITVTLPSPAVVGAGWLMGFSEANGRGVVLDAPGSVYILAAQKSLTSLSLPSDTNYEYAAVQSDGSNFRLLAATQATAFYNGLAAQNFGVWQYLSATGYAATAADGSHTLTSAFTGGAATVTLPSTPLIPNGWSISFSADNGNPITLVPNPLTGGTLLAPYGQPVATYTIAAGQFVNLGFDGANFRVTVPGGTSGGHVSVFPPLSYAAGASVPQVVLSPAGTAVSTAGTTTAGLQEALNFANTQGLSTDLYQPGSSGYTAIASGLVWPPLRNQYFEGHGSALDGTGTGRNVVTLDSMLEAKWSIDGQVGMLPGANFSGDTILVQPQTVLPFENIVGLTDSRLYLGNVSRDGIAGNATIEFDGTYGSIAANFIDAAEVNGAGSGLTPLSNYGIEVHNLAAHGFSNNQIRIGALHLCAVACWQQGGNATDGGNIGYNDISIGRIDPGKNAIGIDTFGNQESWRVNIFDNEAGSGNTIAECVRIHGTANNNKFRINCQGTGIPTGVELQSGATGNDIDLIASGVTTPILDSSGACNTYRLNGQLLQECKGGLQYNWRPLGSVDNGAIVSGATNAEGSVTTNSNVASVTLHFSPAYVNASDCVAETNQPGVFAIPTTESPTIATLTFYNGGGSAVNAPLNSLVNYRCHGGA